jgi:hypothetical protein
MTNKIPVNPKLIYASKSFWGVVIAASGAILGSLGEQPWLPPNIAKIITPIGIAVTFIGNVDRPEIFFRRVKLQEAAAAATKELTIDEAVTTGQQMVQAVLAPAEERNQMFVQLAVDMQQRLTAQDEALARIEEGLRPNRLDEAPGLDSFEVDVTTSSDGVIEGY